MTPRPRNFDEASALQVAKDLFWIQGFEATSMQNLVDTMKIGRQSLYNTFGDKSTLFLRTLALYEDEIQLTALAGLNRKDAGSAQVVAFLRGLLENLASQEPRCGCFLMNAILELSNSNESVMRIAQKFRASLITSIENALARSAARFDIDPNLDVHSLALQISNTAMGLGLTWKSGATKQELSMIVEGAIAQFAPSESLAELHP